MDMITKTIWGDNKARESEEEPVSGERGAGTANDPYDKGNEEAQREDAKDANTAANVEEASVSQSQRDGPSDSVHHTGDPTSGAQPTHKQQGADRPAAAPESGASSTSSGASNTSGKSGSSNKPDMPHTDSQREELMMKGEFPRDPDDHSGEPLHMHGAPADGDKSEEKEDEGDAAAGKAEKSARSASVAQEGGGPHGKTQGTGEKYVKSSGVAADGGDFDASNPGAGKEATRLMEEAGLKTEGQTAPSQQPDAKASKDDSADKHGKLTKLKEKLHIGKAQ